MDALIAATAQVHGLTLVTRNVSEFNGKRYTANLPCWSRAACALLNSFRKFPLSNPVNPTRVVFYSLKTDSPGVVDRMFAVNAAGNWYLTVAPTKITTTWLESRRKPRNRPKERYDETVGGREGLMVRIYPSGAVSFRFRYTNGGKRLVMVLGEFGAVRENEKHFDIEHFTPHDLRRTAASFMTKLKVPRLHVEKVLNHSTGDIAEVYDRHDYLPEKQEALERWAAHLKEILAGTPQKAVPIEHAA